MACSNIPLDGEIPEPFSPFDEEQEILGERSPVIDEEEEEGEELFGDNMEKYVAWNSTMCGKQILKCDVHFPQ